jgi:hypothetical protein
MVGGIIRPTGYNTPDTPVQFHLNKSGVFENLVQVSKDINLIKNTEHYKSYKRIQCDIRNESKSDTGETYDMIDDYPNVTIPSKFNATITDFPGFRFCDEKKFREISSMIYNYDLIIYVIDESKQPHDTNPLYLDLIIQRLEDHYNKLGVRIELCLVVNKMDDISNDDIHDNYVDISGIYKTIPIFRTCSWLMFINQLHDKVFLPSGYIQEYKNILGFLYGREGRKSKILTDSVMPTTFFVEDRPIETGDWDGLMSFLTERKNKH